MVAVCKTVGSAYVGSNPTPATRFRSSEPVTLDCVTGFVRAKGAVHQTVGCGLWAMRGPDPAVCSRRTLSQHDAVLAAENSQREGLGQPRFWPAGRVFVGRGGAAGEEPHADGFTAGADGSAHRSLSRMPTCRARAGAIVGTREVNLRCTRGLCRVDDGIRHGEVHGRDRPKASRPDPGRQPLGRQAHACADEPGCGKLRCCTGRPSRHAARSSAARRSPPWQSLPERLADALPRAGETVTPRAGLRSAHAVRRRRR